MTFWTCPNSHDGSGPTLPDRCPLVACGLPVTELDGRGRVKRTKETAEA